MTETIAMEDDSSVYDSESETLLRHVSLLSDELTTKERLSICCKPSFRLRRLKNKGAILVLVWSFFCLSVPFYYLKTTEGNNLGEFNIEAFALGLILLVAGWIADIRFGRYRVMYVSTWIMWSSMMLVTVSSVLVQTVENYAKIFHNYVNTVLWIILAIGFGGFQANVIQFGIDQLHDASSDEISSLILWYVWTYYSSGFSISFILGCLPQQYWIIGNLLMCTYLSMALSSMLLFNRWLVKEPVTQNPFKLVYNVIRYAIKHKHPECRSAFTYCEDEPPSRIDFGKSKYGGPFTTEQVEDVKTLMRLITFILMGAMIFGVVFASDQLLGRTINMLIDVSVTTSFSLSKCYSNLALIEISLYSGAIILPLHEVIFRSVFHQCLKIVQSYWKFLLGVSLQAVEIISLLTIEVVARYKYLEDTNYNTTIPCYSMANGSLGTSMDFKWMMVPLLIHSLSLCLLGIGCIEFIASQSPYSMRGLLMGTGYCMFALCAAIGVGISIPFTHYPSIWGTGIISCGFWFALLLLVVEVLAGVMYTIMLMWYKKRKREDVLPNEHIFAERYYERDS